jgi:pilus assembly protein Flp/PilA
MRKLLARGKFFSRDEKGATMVEYAIVVGVIAFVAIAGATTFGSDLSSALSKLGGSLGNINTNITAPSGK